jgi:hypothetical protein
VKISPESGNGPKVNASAEFGTAICNLGDLDGNGFEDLAVGAPMEDTLTGSIYILFMKEDYTVLRSIRHARNQTGMPILFEKFEFGTSITNIGDLDGDNVTDIAVGAPGELVPSVFILYLNSDGSIKSNVLIRGEYVGNSPISTGDFAKYTPNGPPFELLSRFGTALAGIGDFNGDGVPDLAASTQDRSSDFNKIYIMFLDRNGTVLNYTEINTLGGGGGPVLPTDENLNFGSSLLSVGDVDLDGINDLAVGAKGFNDGFFGRSGAVFVLYMAENGTVKEFTKVSEASEPFNREVLIESDECGAALGSNGDINRDNIRQQRIPPPFGPLQLASPPRPSIPDIIMGCPQGSVNGGKPGRSFFLYLLKDKTVTDYTEIPADTDYRDNVQPDIQTADRFGSAIVGYQDLDNNGVRELVVGAPGDGANSGALYILFLRRRRHHVPAFCSICFYGPLLGVLAAILAAILSVILLILYFCKRNPDDVEIAAAKAGLIEEVKVFALPVTDEDRLKRTKTKKTKKVLVYTEEYPI